MAVGPGRKFGGTGMDTTFAAAGEGRVVRRIALARRPASGQVDAAAARLGGMAQVHVHAVAPRVLCVAYRVSEIGYGDVLRVLRDCGLGPRADPWQRLRAAWLDYMDTNARNHLKEHGACCARPDAVYGRRRGK